MRSPGPVPVLRHSETAPELIGPSADTSEGSNSHSRKASQSVSGSGIPGGPKKQLSKLQRVLGEEAPDPGDLARAPILGKQLLHAVEAEGTVSGTVSGAVQHGSGLAGIAELLQKKLDNHSPKQRGWRSLTFDEHEVERSFRAVTFQGQRLSFVMASACLAAITVGVIIYEAASPCTNPDEECGDTEAVALSLWGASAAALVVTCFVILYATRTVALVLMVLVVWTYSVCNTLALYQDQRLTGGQKQSVY